jgi:uncharacterized membrane protein YdfJ with MMPL/SSD domain
LDATLVRALLVPAAMRLLGEWKERQEPRRLAGGRRVDHQDVIGAGRALVVDAQQV